MNNPICLYNPWDGNVIHHKVESGEYPEGTRWYTWRNGLPSLSLGCDLCWSNVGFDVKTGKRIEHEHTLDDLQIITVDEMKRIAREGHA
jgi:hypothetical protein